MAKFTVKSTGFNTKTFATRGGPPKKKDQVAPTMEAVDEINEIVIESTGFRERAKAEAQRREDATDAEYVLVPVEEVETVEGSEEIPLYPAIVFQSRALKEEFLQKMAERFPGEILGDKFISGDVLARALGFKLTAHRPQLSKVKPPNKRLLELRK